MVENKLKKINTAKASRNKKKKTLISGGEEAKQENTMKN